MLQMERVSGCFPNYWDTPSAFVTSGKRNMKSWYGMQIFVTNRWKKLLHQMIKTPGILSRNRNYIVASCKFQTVPKGVPGFRCNFVQIDDKGTVYPHKIWNNLKLLLNIFDGITDHHLVWFTINEQMKNNIVPLRFCINKLVWVKIKFLFLSF